MILVSIFLENMVCFEVEKQIEKKSSQETKKSFVSILSLYQYKALQLGNRVSLINFRIS